MENNSVRYDYIPDFLNMLGFRHDREQIEKDLRHFIDKEKKEEYQRGFDKGKAKGLAEGEKTSYEHWWKSYARETHEKEDYVRLFLMIYDALDKRDVSAEEFLDRLKVLLHEEFCGVIGAYIDTPIEKQDRNIVKRIKRRAAILSGKRF